MLHSESSAAALWLFHKSKKDYRASVRGRFAANNSEALLAAVKRGLGIGLLASWLVESDVRHGILRIGGPFPPCASTRFSPCKGR